ncbi:MAG: hypothetical protein Rhirs2KO_09710 [Rhizobiaceae bacterium]
MASIDHLKLAGDVIAALKRDGLSYAGAMKRHPGLDGSMLSRACNANPLSAANHLLVCEAFGLSPADYLIRELQPRTTVREILKRMQNQLLAEGAKRETGEAA